VPIAPIAEETLDLLAQARGWIFDIDGTLMRTAKAGGEGGRAIPGGIDFLRQLRASGRRIMVCTQASTRPPAAYADILNEAGYSVDGSEIMTAGLGAALYLQQHYPGGHILVLGSEGITVPLALAGLTVVQLEKPGAIDAVVVGHANAFESRVLDFACKAIIDGAGFYTTTDEFWFHGGLGRSLAPSGFMAAAIGTVCGRSAEVLGKPSPALGRLLLDHLRLSGCDVVVVDDNIPHGIRLAHAMGAHSVMPLSGASMRADAESLARREAPTLICDDVGDLGALLGSRLRPID
jgi:NagD protein